jgi:hypothetical protein
VPIGLAALVVTRLRLRESRPGRLRRRPPRRGAAVPPLFLLVYALIRGNEEGWGSALVRSRDFVAGGGPVAAPPEPARV